MKNTNENTNSSNGENKNQNSSNQENGGQEDPTVLREKLVKLEDDNKKLFARAKKAEGFVFQDGSWVKPEPKKDEKSPPKTGELDYAQKAYLKSSGINSDEFDFVKEQMEKSGKDLDSLLVSGYFQSELKSVRDAKAVAKATPASTRGGDQPETTKVDYWIAKGELPPDLELRTQVVNKKIELARQGHKF